MIKVNLSDGNEIIQPPGEIPENILKLAKTFWGGKTIPIFYTKRKALYSELVPKQDRKFLFLKIKQINNLPSLSEQDIASNIFWCKNGQIEDFYKNDINNITTFPDGKVIYNENLPTSTEIFGLHRKDLNEIRIKIFNKPDDKPEHVVQAILYKNILGQSRIYFFMDPNIVVPKQEGILNYTIPVELEPIAIAFKPGSSGVKVPKGGAQ